MRVRPRFLKFHHTAGGHLAQWWEPDCQQICRPNKKLTMELSRDLCTITRSGLQSDMEIQNIFYEHIG
jgi:hypothetical protein